MRDLQTLLQRLGFIVSGGNTIGMYNFFAQWGERDTAYVSMASRLAAPGWDAVDVFFGSDVPARMMRELEREMRDRYRFRYFTDTRVGGRRVWIMTLQRILRLTGVSGVAAQQPAIDPTWLYFTMPEGGTVTLNRVGSPTAVTLEVSLDNGATWSEWAEVGTARTQTLTAGQVMHVRNTSETSTGFSTYTTNYYNFSFSADTYAGGDLRSLLCKTPANASSAERTFCFYRLFLNATNLISAKIKLLFTDLPRSFYRSMFEGCSNLIEGPETITATTCSGVQPCYQMFKDCSIITKLPKLTILILSDYCYGDIAQNCRNLNYVYTEMIYISTNLNALYNWLDNVSPIGDFYCPAELTIPIGVDGIPTGWTRHDI